jgi:hypothetical protein
MAERAGSETVGGWWTRRSEGCVLTVATGETRPPDVPEPAPSPDPAPAPQPPPGSPDPGPRGRR